MRPSMRNAAAAVVSFALFVNAYKESVVDVFYPGLQSGVAVYRIPAISRTKSGYLLALAEARTCTDSDCCFKWLVGRQSQDDGNTWSAPINITGSTTPTLSTGNPQASTLTAMPPLSITSTVHLPKASLTLSCCRSYLTRQRRMLSLRTRSGN
jgi:hypothetical protein